MFADDHRLFVDTISCECVRVGGWVLPLGTRETLTRHRLSPAGEAGPRGAAGGTPAERQEAHSGTHTLPPQRQLHVPPTATRGPPRPGSSPATSTDPEVPAHTGGPQGPIR